MLEGPRVVAAALDRGAQPETVYLAPGADRAFAPLVERIREAEIRIEHLKEGVLERISATVTPQPVLAVAARVTRPIEQLVDDGLVLVLVSVQDPGNAGTLIRTIQSRRNSPLRARRSRYAYRNDRMTCSFALR